ncbi:MAG: hypothetical protein B7Z66_15580 [Chromatiales bacterium 21-64-14]|nr:MAG: hypothetical protein B7Z66_15580 [Chromatiales bacterium 21-64-14]
MSSSSGIFGPAFTLLVKGVSSGGVSASASQTDGPDTQAATGTPLIVLNAAQTDGADTQAASGTVGSPVSASAAQTDGADTQAATGTPLIVASSAQTDGADTQSATGTPLIVLSAAQTDGADPQAATGTSGSAVSASATQTDGADTQSATGSPVIVSSAAQADGADIQTTAGTPLIVLSAAQTDGADIQVATNAQGSIVCTAAQRDGADVQSASVVIAYTFDSAVALFAAIQAGIPFFYTGSKPLPLLSQAFSSSGTFTVPAGVTQILVSATAAGGTPMGTAGQQVIKQTVNVTPGQVITITIGPNVTLTSNGATLLTLLAGSPYSKGTRQGTIQQDSGITGLGFGTDSGPAGKAAVVMLWS